MNELDRLKLERVELQQKQIKYARENKLEYYSPYPFQLKFHYDKSKHVSLNAGNKPGKTECGGADVAYHSTGRYPDDWEGMKFDHPIDVIVGGKTNIKVRNLGQQWLLGKPGNSKMLGTMYIPKKDILFDKMIRKPGVPGAWDKVYIKHHTNGFYDGDTQITFLAYDAEKEAWMGDPADLVWLDEEPPSAIFGQATRSVIATGGYIKQTFTPENGRTEVLKVIEESWSVHHATWMDAAGGDFTIELPKKTLEFKTVYGKNGQKGHLTEEKVRDALKGMLPHEIEMRVLGEPMQGSGLIFSYPEDQVMCQPVEIPDHWPRIAAMDFGGLSEKAHPSAAAWLAHDVDNDVIYVYDCLKLYSNKPADISARIIGRPQWIPMMWPHDGQKDAPEGGVKVKDMYKNYGVNMFETWATNQDDDKQEGKGAYRREPALIEMNARFTDRRLRVFNTLPEIWEEIRNFHTIRTAEGKAKIIDRDDDLISAIRYGVMMIRHAVKESDIEDYEFEDDHSYGPTAGTTTGYG